jgi:hypothetical protein
VVHRSCYIGYRRCSAGTGAGDIGAGEMGNAADEVRAGSGRSEADWIEEEWGLIDGKVAML